MRKGRAISRREVLTTGTRVAASYGLGAWGLATLAGCGGHTDTPASVAPKTAGTELLILPSGSEEAPSSSEPMAPQWTRILPRTS